MEAIKDLASRYPITAEVSIPKNGHMYQLLLGNNSNASETARDVLKKFPTPGLAVDTLVGRLLTIKRKLQKLVKYPTRNWDRIESLLQSPFSLEPSSRPKPDPPVPSVITHDTPASTGTCLESAVPLDNATCPETTYTLVTASCPVTTAALPITSAQHVTLRSDCDNCPQLRCQLVKISKELRTKHLDTLREIRVKNKELRQVKLMCGDKARNRYRRESEQTKLSLRSDKRKLKRDNKLLVAENLRLTNKIQMLANAKKEIDNMARQLSKKEKEAEGLKHTIGGMKAHERNLNLELDNLKCCIEEDELDVDGRLTVSTKQGKFYTPSIRLCMYQCLQSGVPVEKASELIKFIACHLCKTDLGPMPAVSTTAQFAYELGVISDIQVAEALYTCETATLGWDGTGLGGAHYNEVHVSLKMKDQPKGTLLQMTLQTAEIAGSMYLYMFKFSLYSYFLFIKLNKVKHSQTKSMKKTVVLK